MPELRSRPEAEFQASAEHDIRTAKKIVGVRVGDAIIKVLNSAKSIFAEDDDGRPQKVTQFLADQVIEPVLKQPKAWES